MALLPHANNSFRHIRQRGYEHIQDHLENVFPDEARRKLGIYGVAFETNPGEDECDLVVYVDYTGEEITRIREPFHKERLTSLSRAILRVQAKARLLAL